MLLSSKVNDPSNFCWFQSFEDSIFEEADPKAVVSVILGGGAGTRLFPLTSRRAKPAVRITTHIFA